MHAEARSIITASSMRQVACRQATRVRTGAWAEDRCAPGGAQGLPGPGCRRPLALWGRTRASHCSFGRRAGPPPPGLCEDRGGQGKQQASSITSRAGLCVEPQDVAVHAHCGRAACHERLRVMHAHCGGAVRHAVGNTPTASVAPASPSLLPVRPGCTPRQPQPGQMQTHSRQLGQMQAHSRLASAGIRTQRPLRTQPMPASVSLHGDSADHICTVPMSVHGQCLCPHWEERPLQSKI